ncbi:MAG: response regulator transcription factor [Deinococcales bacterium]
MNILVVEDEAILAQMLRAKLEHEGYNVRWADCIEKAWDQLAQVEPDLIALDVMLPEGEDAGFDFAKRLRLSEVNIPILFLSARDSTEDRIQGLDLGGDDYLVKPYNLDEFMARVRALLRRESQVKSSLIQRGLLELDLQKRQVSWDKTPISLSKREFALLELFALNPDRIYDPDELLERIFPETETDRRLIRVYIHYLRQKLAKNIILTATGGYRLGL